MKEKTLSRDSTIFYASFYDAIEDLPEKDQNQVYKAIFELSLRGNEIELTGISKTIFTLIKPQIMANLARYDNGKKGAIHGKKGGRPLQEKPLTKPQDNPEITPNLTPNKNNNKNVNNNKNISYSLGEKINENEEFFIEESPDHENALQNLRENAFKNWEVLAKEGEINFTQNEWSAIKGFCFGKPSLPIHQIKVYLMQLDKWANEGLDIIDSLLRSTNTKTLIRPFARIETDNKGNRIYGKLVNDIREREI